MKNISILFIIMFLCSCSNVYEERNKFNLAIQVGALDKALEIAKKNVRDSPNDIDYRFQLADVYYRMKKYNMELDELLYLNKIVVRPSNVSDSLDMKLMRNKLSRGEYISVLNDAMKYRSNGVSKSDIDVGKSYLYSGVSLCKQQKLNECQKDFYKAKELLPGDESVLQNIALVNWEISSNQNTTDEKNTSELFEYYKEHPTDHMFSLIVLSLVQINNYSKAYELLLTRYNPEDAHSILNDLKRMRL